MLVVLFNPLCKKMRVWNLGIVGNLWHLKAPIGFQHPPQNRKPSINQKKIGDDLHPGFVGLQYGHKTGGNKTSRNSKVKAQAEF